VSSLHYDHATDVQRKKGGPITCVWCRAAWETPAGTKGDPNGQITTSSKG
jgi:hypothetical protein